MANNCFFEMKVIGKEKNVEKWIDKMENYESENHFYRIFSCDEYDRSIKDNNDVIAIYLQGDCAWSLETCCRASGYSNGVDLFMVNTADLDLKMEAWASEYGVGFQEHYIYDKGECIVDECEEATEYWFGGYPSFEEFLEDHPNAPKDINSYDENDCFVVGGFGHFGKFTI